jgi:D-alanyl-lipoteichoic acid acyltransferase DltB (MBOAT superfamily)
LRVAWGFFKKLIVADTAMMGIKTLIERSGEFQGVYVALLILLYSAQIYGDFTGGIDITIGLSEMMGIKLSENFNRPFSSRSTKEYWNRWHITMGSWFTDYIFYPLSITKSMQKLSKWSRAHLGNALGKRIPVYTATIATWFLTGLWHGASWNFIVWGLLNCLIILVSQECQPLYNKLHAKFPTLAEKKPWILYLRAQTFMLMGTIRILDVYRDVPMTFKMLGTVFYDGEGWRSFFGGGFLKVGLDIKSYLIIAIGICLMTAVSEIGARGEKPLRHRLAVKPLALFTCAALLIAATLIFGSYGIGFDASQFIYTQF